MGKRIRLSLIIIFLIVCRPAGAQNNTLNLSLNETGLDPNPLRFAIGSGPAQVFHGVIATDGSGPPSAYLDVRSINTAETSQVFVPIAGAVQSGRTYAEFNGPSTVGVAFSNPNDWTVAVSFYFTASDGSDLGAGNITIPPHGQIARFLNESPFNAPASLTGTFTFTADAPVGVAALRGYVNETGAFLLADLPVIALNDPGSTIIPHFFSGDGHEVEVILVNPGDTTVTGTIAFVIAGQVTTTVDYSVPARSARQFSTGTSLPGSPVRNGFIRLQPSESSHAPSAFAISSRRIETNARTAYQTTIRGQRAANAFRLLAEGIRPGGARAYETHMLMALANPSTDPTLVTVELASPAPAATRVLNIPANGKVVMAVEDIFDLQGMTGGYFSPLRVTSSSPIAAVGLYGNSTLAAIEAVDETAPMPDSAPVPQIVVGGYESRLLLFRGSNTQSSSGVLRLFSQSGSPIDLTATRLTCTSRRKFSVLIFTKTTGFRHDSIPAGIAAVRRLGSECGFDVDTTENDGLFTEQNLARYRVVVFLNTTGDVLDPDQQTAFEHFIQSGGGFVGIHSATDTEYDWPWYGQLVGAYFGSHPEIQRATTTVVDAAHLSTRQLPLEWTRTDEWYDFSENPGANVNVLVRVGATTYSAGQNGGQHPVSWYHEYDGGRAWYTAMGHTTESYREPLFLAHVLGGITWAANALFGGDR